MSAIQSIHINNLQRLRDITVDFEQAGVTAIMGVNGSGKTTLLQAIACVFQRDTTIELEQQSYAYSDFFKPYEGYDWLGSSFGVSFYDEDNSVIYSKDDDFWNPRAQNKKQRYVKYVSMLDCIPHQEKEIGEEIANFEKKDIGLRPAKRTTFLQEVSGALHRNYMDVGNCEKEDGLDKFFFARIQNHAQEEIEYPSHYMGAGEQKIVYIINEVLKAPDGALILIEELDVSLHDSAIKSLINFLQQQAISRQIQIVFTTHWLGVQALSDDVNIVSLFEEPATRNIVVREAFDPQFIHGLNNDNEQRRQIKVWVEDTLTQKIVELVAREMGVMHFLKIKVLGSIQNVYKIAGAIAVMGDNLDRTIIVTDGDRYIEQGEKDIQIGHAIDGNGEQATSWRRTALELVVDLDAPEKSEPERVILKFCQELVDQDNVHNWVKEDLDWISKQHPVPVGKEAIRQLQQDKGMELNVLQTQYLDIVCNTDSWSEYVHPLKEKLRELVANIGIVIRDQGAVA